VLPDFNEHGYLPAGIYFATLDEIDNRFGRFSQIREVQMESLRWLVASAAQAGVKRIIINGSFISDRLEPNDVDCVLLIDSEYPRDKEAAQDLLNGYPFLEISLVTKEPFELLVNTIFSTDRHLVPKGVVEVVL
jgi:hypothetical protein